MTYSSSCGFSSPNAGCFNGTNSSIYIPNNISLANTNWTVEATIYPTSITGTHGILARHDGGNWNTLSYYFAITDGHMIAYLGNNGSSAGSTFTSTYTLSVNTIQTVRFTYDGSSVKMYVNGSLKDTFTLSNMNLNNISNLYVGSLNGQYHQFSGGIKNLFVMNVASATSTGFTGGQSASNVATLDTTVHITYVAPPVLPQVSMVTSSYPTASTTQIATGTIALITQATTTQYTTYTPFSNYVSDSRGFNTTYFTLNGVLVGAYSYQIGNESGTSKLTFVHTNYLGTPVLETDDKGDIVQMDITDVFGNYVQRDQRMDNAYHTKGYIGQEYDDVTNLSYLHARYLDTTSHSFMSVDPLIYSLPTKYLYDPQQMNSYAYARNNPIVYSDPSGLSIWSDVKDAVSGFLGKVSNFFSPTTSSSNTSSPTKKPADIINQPTTKTSSTNSQTTTKTTNSSSNNFSSYNTQFASVESTLAGKPYPDQNQKQTAGPDYFDCSGAVTYGIRQTANPKFGRYNADTLYKGYSIPTDSKGAGTVTYYDYEGDGKIDHVATNLGDGYMINPLNPTVGVRRSDASIFNPYVLRTNPNAKIYNMQLDWTKITQ
jgi:RHS repeat-associated protein